MRRPPSRWTRHPSQPVKASKTRIQPLSWSIAEQSRSLPMACRTQKSKSRSTESVVVLRTGSWSEDARDGRSWEGLGFSRIARGGDVLCRPARVSVAASARCVNNAALHSAHKYASFTETRQHCSPLSGLIASQRMCAMLALLRGMVFALGSPRPTFSRRLAWSAPRTLRVSWRTPANTRESSNPARVRGRAIAR